MNGRANERASERTNDYSNKWSKIKGRIAQDFLLNSYCIECKLLHRVEIVVIMSQRNKRRMTSILGSHSRDYLLCMLIPQKKHLKAK